MKQVSININNDVSQIRVVSKALGTFAEEVELPNKILFNFDLALEELISNIILHGYSNKASEPILIELNYDEQSGNFEAIITDTAEAYNPLEHDEPDVTLSAEERNVGGLGILLVKKKIPQLSYSRKNGKNRIILSTKIITE